MKTARPLDAASLIIYERNKTGIHVLMGRRNRSSGFAPGLYAFPGGVLEACDRQSQVDGQCSGLKFNHPRGSRLERLSLTAIRETWEETGLMLATFEDCRGNTASHWNAFRRAGLLPAPQHLAYLGRAITPAQYPRRYHARFFTAARECFHGKLRSNGELLDLQWVRLDRVEHLPMLDVTAFMLEELARSITGKRQRAPLMSYRCHHTLIRYEPLEHAK